MPRLHRRRIWNESRVRIKRRPDEVSLLRPHGQLRYGGHPHNRGSSDAAPPKYRVRSTPDQCRPL